MACGQGKVRERTDHIYCQNYQGSCDRETGLTSVACQMADGNNQALRNKAEKEHYPDPLLPFSLAAC